LIFNRIPSGEIFAIAFYEAFVATLHRPKMIGGISQLG